MRTRAAVLSMWARRDFSQRVRWTIPPQAVRAAPRKSPGLSLSFVSFGQELGFIGIEC